MPSPYETPRGLSPGETGDVDAKKSNDVAYSTVSLLPVSVSLPAGPSPGGSARDAVLSTLVSYGSSALASSDLVGDRFESLDLGAHNGVPVAASSKRLRSSPSGAGRVLSDRATLNVVGGSVTLSGAYWEDDPTPGEVTEVFLEGVGTREARDSLAAALRPLVCGDSPDCALDAESVGVYLADDSAAAGWASPAGVPDPPATAAEDGGRASGAVVLAGAEPVPGGGPGNAGTVAGAAGGALAALLLAAVALFVLVRKRRAARGSDEASSRGTLREVEPEITPEDAYDEITTEARAKEANIASILEAMSDDGQSSVASSQVSGLTGIETADGGATPPGSPSPPAGTPGPSPPPDCCGYLPASLSVSSPEPFQTEYQTRSAVARLGLRKDMLRAADDVAGPTPGGDGTGGARTVSPRDAAATEEARRRRRAGMSSRLRGGGGGGGGGGAGGEADDASLLVPVDFARSDLV